MSKHTFHIQNPSNIPVSIGLTTLAHDFQYARFHILVGYLHFEQFWSADIPIMTCMMFVRCCDMVVTQ